MRSFLLPLVVLMGCAGARPHESGERPRTSDRINIKSRFELPNGLAVVMQENHSAPVVAVQAWVRAGSADESPAESGAAHLFEHLLVNAEMYRRAEALGGTLASRAGYDYTWVQAVISRRDFETGAALVARAIAAPSFTEADVQREAASTKDELHRALVTPAQRLQTALFETVYTTHPYRRPLLGSDETLKQLSRATLMRFHERFYTPANTVLVVTGDATPSEARAILERVFKDFTRRSTPKAKRPDEPAQTTPRSRLIEFPTSEVYVSAAWPIPGLDHPDATALSLLAVVLGQGHGSRLSERLVKESAWVQDVYGFSYTQNGPGLLAVGFVAAPPQAQSAALQLLGEADRLRNEVISEAELKRAKAIVLGDTYYNNQTVEGLASKTGFFEASLGDASVEERFGREIEKTTVVDLRRVAAKYLDAKAFNLVALVPKNARDTLKEDEVIARAKTLDEAYAARQDVKLPPAGNLSVHRVRLPSGTTILLQPDRSLPIVAVRAAFVGGLRYEAKGTNGIHALLARVLGRATERRSPKEMTALKESLAATIEGFAGQNAFGLHAELLKSTAGEGLDLIAEILSSPRFLAEDVDRERAVLLAEIRSRENHPPSAIFDLFTEALYDAHPYRLRAKGSVDAVSALRDNELLRFFKKTYTRDKLVLAVVGDFEPAEMLAQLGRLFGASRDKGEAPKLPASEAALDKARVIERNKDRAAAYAVLGFRGAAFGDKDRYALGLLSTILGGEGGRLSRALKEKLASQVASVSVEGLEPGYFATYLSTSPDKLEPAIEAVKKELARLQQAPVGSDELERARRYLQGSHAIGLQRQSSRAASLALNELFGNGFDEDASFDAQIGSVSAGDVQRVAQEYLDVGKSVLAVIKPGKSE